MKTPIKTNLSIVEAFQKKAYPLGFSFLNQEKEPVMLMKSGEATNEMILTLWNASPYNIQFQSGSGNTPSPDHYHFALRFRPGILVKTSNIVLSSSLHDWNIHVQEEANSGITTLYFLNDPTEILAPNNTKGNQSLSFKIKNLHVNPTGGSRTTRVELLYQDMILENQTTAPMKGAREQVLNLIDHIGKEHIPLHLETIGLPSILNDGKTKNQFTLRVRNIGLNPITLNGKNSNAKLGNSKLMISFDAGNQEWDLTTQDNIQTTTIHVPNTFFNKPNSGTSLDTLLTGNLNFAIYNAASGDYFYVSDSVKNSHQVVQANTDVAKIRNTMLFQLQKNPNQSGSYYLFNLGTQKYLCLSDTSFLSDYYDYPLIGIDQLKSDKCTCQISVIDSAKQTFNISFSQGTTPYTIGISTSDNIPKSLPNSNVVVATGDWTELMFDVDQSSNWSFTTPDAEAESLQWTFVPKQNFHLAPNEYLDFSITGLVSGSATGQAHAYIHYQDIPGYWDGKLICTLQKSPVAVNGQSVGVNAMPQNSQQGNLFVEAYNNILPVGTILMWHGSSNNPPLGWAICNGKNGTPDLQNRFIVGAGDDYDLDGTGGSNSVTLTSEQMPQHYHSIDLSHNHSINDPSHTHGLTKSYGFHLVSESSGSEANDLYQKDDSQSSMSIENNTTGISINSALGVETTNDTGGGQSHENRPPFYALYYIMKINDSRKIQSL